MKSKIKIFITLLMVVLFVGAYFLPGYVLGVRWNIISREASALGGECSYQIGLLKTNMTQCMASCQVEGVATCCIGSGGPSVLCPTIVPEGTGTYETTCPLYTDVSGTQAGGMGTMALFSKVAIAKAGLAPGGQLIACGMTMTNMDQGMLASAGGCSGCNLAKLNKRDRFVMRLSDFFIATFKN